jgi:hypothetical protein
MLDWMEFDNLPADERDEFMNCDIILGSEVSYLQNRETLSSLLGLIDQTLSPQGAVYFIQSVDRGTHDDLLEGMRANGFEIDIRDVPASVLAYFSTGQLLEHYRFYSFRRPGSPFPVMDLTFGPKQPQQEE